MMTRIAVVVTGAIAVLAAAMMTPGQAGAVPDLSGTWDLDITGEFPFPVGEATLNCTTEFEQNGDTLDAVFHCGVATGTGTATVTQQSVGANIEVHLELAVTGVGNVVADAVGTIAPDGNSMEGTWTSATFDTEGVFSGERQVAQYLHGDLNCDGAVNAIDALTAIRHDVGADVFQHEGCPEIESEFASLFGDVNCDDDVNSVDALRILRYSGGLPLPAIEGCPAIGDTIVAAD